MVLLKVKPGVSYEIYALEDGGRCEVLDFLSILAVANQREFEKLIKDFDRTADTGLIRNPEKFKLLVDGIYEFKTYGGVRILCFLDGRHIVVLTNGFMKKKKYDSEIQRAINLRVKYMNAKANYSLTYREELL
jgi:transketolase C-terminal domain/subunit